LFPLCNSIICYDGDVNDDDNGSDNYDKEEHDLGVASFDK